MAKKSSSDQTNYFLHRWLAYLHLTHYEVQAHYCLSCQSPDDLISLVKLVILSDFPILVHPLK